MFKIWTIVKIYWRNLNFFQILWKKTFLQFVFFFINTDEYFPNLCEFHCSLNHFSEHLFDISMHVSIRPCNVQCFCIDHRWNRFVFSFMHLSNFILIFVFLNILMLDSLHGKVIICSDFIESPRNEFDIESVDFSLCTHLIIKDFNWQTREGNFINFWKKKLYYSNLVWKDPWRLDDNDNTYTKFTNLRNKYTHLKVVKILHSFFIQLQTRGESVPKHRKYQKVPKAPKRSNNHRKKRQTPTILFLQFFSRIYRCFWYLLESFWYLCPYFYKN